jgi:hypothetical protein
MTLDSVVPNRLRPLTRVSHRFPHQEEAGA